jgi:hypothetical protein
VPRPPASDVLAVTAIMLLAVLVLVAFMQRAEAPPRPGAAR